MLIVDVVGLWCVNKMFKERPECAVPGCKNLALVMYSNKLICGECLNRIYIKHQEIQWEELVKDASDKSSK